MLSYNDLLAKIYEDEKVELVLESIGCHSINFEQGGYLIVAARPEGDNKRAVQIKNERELKAIIRTTGTYGNLLDIVKEISEFEYISDVKDYLMSICGYSDDTIYEEPPLVWLNKIKRQRKFYDLTYDLPIIDEEVLDQFIYGDITQFNKDNISTTTLKKFSVGYDSITKRITIPIYDILGNLIGIKGRTTVKNEEDYWKFFFLYPCDQSKTLYNYWRSKDICISNEVNLFEAEKSCMQTEEFGVLNTMAIGSSNISHHQLNLLLGLNCDINLCFDEGLDLKVVTEPFFKFFNGKRNVFVTVDKYGLLPKKASPSDCGKKVWDELYKNRIVLCKGE